MAEILHPSPQTTLVVLLGASEFPQAPSFEPSEAFANSARDLETYFLSIFQLPKDNLLNLFDADDSPPDLEKRIVSFLKARTAELKQSGFTARDVIFYYVGHGGFTRSNRYQLLIRYTQEPGPQSSKLEMESLARTIKENTRSLRRILILDCCFSANAVQYQAGPMEVALRQTTQAFEEKDLRKGFPTQGTSLLCSSDRHNASITFPGAKHTTFSEALLFVLNNGDEHSHNNLSLHALARLMDEFLFNHYQDQAPRPEVHSPDQSKGDVASIPFFPNNANIIQTSYETGDRNYDSGQYEEALIAYRNVLHWNPTHAVVYSKIGDSLNALQRYEEALVAYQEALRLAPHQIHVYYQKGNVLAHLKRYEEALAVYQESLRLHPHSIFAYNAIGDTLYALQRYNEALIAYENALELDPYFPPAINNRRKVLRTLGRENEQQGIDEQAPPFVKKKAPILPKIEESEERSYFDVCVVCALAEEAKAFKRIAERFYDVQFTQGLSKHIGGYFHATMLNMEKKSFTIHLSCPPNFGPIETALHLKPVLNEFRPRFVVMTGICAGDARRTRLGDLVIAEQAFSLDTGKIVLDENGQKNHSYDTTTYSCTSGVLQFARMFDAWKSEITKIQLPPSFGEERSIPDIHILSMASSGIIRIDDPFYEIQNLVPRTGALDQESAVFYRTVREFPDMHSLLVKGVCDHADGRKSDSFHEYAAEASSVYALSFMKEYIAFNRLLSRNN